MVRKEGGRAKKGKGGTEVFGAVAAVTVVFFFSGGGGGGAYESRLLKANMLGRRLDCFLSSCTELLYERRHDHHVIHTLPFPSSFSAPIKNTVDAIFIVIFFFPPFFPFTSSNLLYCAVYYRSVEIRGNPLRFQSEPVILITAWSLHFQTGSIPKCSPLARLS